MRHEWTFNFLSPKAQRPTVQLSLPLSKSVRARELVLDALNGREIEVEEENDDIFVLSRALYNSQFTIHNSQLSDKSDWSDESDNAQFSIFNLKDSGTALRFMTAFCAVSEGENVLTGSKRLCERPIKPLVDALCRMGAEIEYVEKSNFEYQKINQTEPLNLQTQEVKEEIYTIEEENKKITFNNAQPPELKQFLESQNCQNI